MDTARTPVLSDKRLWLSVGTILSLLATKFMGLQLDPELLATIAVTVVGYITNSAVKEAKVAGIVAANKITNSTDAVGVLNSPGPQP